MSFLSRPDEPTTPEIRSCSFDFFSLSKAFCRMPCCILNGMLIFPVLFWLTRCYLPDMLEWLYLPTSLKRAFKSRFLSIFAFGFNLFKGRLMQPRPSIASSQNQQLYSSNERNPSRYTSRAQQRFENKLELYTHVGLSKFNTP